MTRLHGVTLTIFCTYLLGCAHSAGNSAALDSAKRNAAAKAVARSVVLCQTTESELRAALGPPTRDGLLHQQRIVSWIISDEGAVKYLAVALDERAVVVDLYWDIPTEIPWNPRTHCAP